MTDRMPFRTDESDSAASTADAETDPELEAEESSDQTGSLHESVDRSTTDDGRRPDRPSQDRDRSADRGRGRTRTRTRTRGADTDTTADSAAGADADTDADGGVASETAVDGSETTDSVATASSTVSECPDCGGQIVHEADEYVCERCGLVVEERRIDPGPEWRAFDQAEKEKKSRVGAPTTKMLHDEGLSTEIGWQDKDAYGKALSSRQRQKMQRLRTWDERFRTKDSRDRSLKQALGEIDRMASALGLPENVRETASVIYRRALEDDLLPGRSIEGMATAALYAAARMANVPRSIDEVATVSRVDDQEFKRTYRYMLRELDLEIEPADPVEYVPRFASRLAVDNETERRARQVLETAKSEGVHSGKSPVGLAAAALYAAGLLCNEELTQREVSEATDISEVTIRNRYQELLDAHDDAHAPADARGLAA